jgi:hypothetical protein
LRLRSTSAFSRAACFGALVGLAGVAVHSIVDFGLHLTINAVVLFALVTIATANVRPAAGEETVDRGRVRQ